MFLHMCHIFFLLLPWLYSLRKNSLSWISADLGFIKILYVINKKLTSVSKELSSFNLICARWDFPVHSVGDVALVSCVRYLSLIPYSNRVKEKF